MHTLRLSSKGQITLPKSLRDEHRWKAGTEFIVEDRPDGVLLRAIPCPASLEDVAGSLPYTGKPKTLAQMDRAIISEIKS